MEILWFLIVGLVAGWLASMLAKGGGYGLLGDMVVGVLGALLGGFLFSTLGGAVDGGLLGCWRLGVLVQPVVGAQGIQGGMHRQHAVLQGHAGKGGLRAFLRHAVPEQTRQRRR